MQVVDENQPANVARNGAKALKKSKTIEETYTKMSQLEHILLRPDTYIGSIEKQTQPHWVYSGEQRKMINKTVSYVPGLFKIFDEIIVNAADNKQRDPTMNKIDVTIDAAENKIRVWNNGRGIPVAIHQEHNIYVPELIFGNLLTGSNFDDKEEKTTGGRNGYGAKLANIFSTKFIVETADSSRGLKFVQEFRNNMSTKDAPRITKFDGTDYTCITFYPDLARFKMEELDEDIIGLLAKRVFDIAATNSGTGSKLRVHLNGERLDVQRFEQYLEMYEGIEAPVYFEKLNDRWEIGVGVSDGSFQHISFVNSISTSKGGTHVNFVADKIVSRLAAVVKKRNKGEEVKANQIKNHLAIFVNALIVNPAFDSQTKENLTTKAGSFGSTCEIPDKMIKAIEKSPIIDNILSWSKHKQTQELKKKSGSKHCKVLGITKLDDANCAGTSKSGQCTLILTEGDSAKALAISGLGVVGRDYYGVFPLKGKLLNVREATHAQIMKNEEIQNITKILGLTFGKEYTDTASLRYGHLMIMTDQDHDGSHIKGLLINFLHHFWPSLLQINGFLQQFITPIVKCCKGKTELPFYTIPEYKAWKEEHDDGKGWKIKYYKGLGTSTAAEAKEYFSNLGTHEIAFRWDDNANDMIEMAFAKKRVEDRKLWLLAMEPGVHIDYKGKHVTYDNFINHELILFSHADNERSIAHFMDGMKPSQRKVLYSCFKRNLRQEIKVAQLAGYVSEHSAYHHGEASLTQTIIGMAQNFVGSNNINLLSPCGQFGTRLMGGKDAASPRYVFTKLENVTRAIFHPDDDALLEYLEDDGQQIEPLYYVPIVPMALINGCEGIGTGWSSSVPTYNPRELIANLRRMIQGEEPEEMLPWFRGFTGTVQQKAPNSYLVTGTMEEVDEQTVRISELPVGKWTTDYKQYLESVLIGNTAAKDAKDETGPATVPFVKDFKENHTDTTVLFTVTAPPEKLVEYAQEKGGLIKKFKLDTTISTTNMNMFDLGSQIKKYDGPLHLLREFFQVRMQYYDHRKAYLLGKLTNDWEKLDNKVRFLMAVIKGDIVVANRKKTDLLQDIRAHGLKAFYESKEAKNKDQEGDQDSDTESAIGSASLEKGYDYLLSLKLWNLTMEKVQELTNQRNNKQQELDTLRATSAETLWLQDLTQLEIALDSYEASFDEAKAQELAAQKKAQKNNSKSQGVKRIAVAKKVVVKKNKGSDDEDEDSADDMDMDEDSDFEDKPKKKAAAVVKKVTAPVAASTVAVTRVVSEPTVASASTAAAKVKKAVAGEKSSAVDKTVKKAATLDTWVSKSSTSTATAAPVASEGLSLMERLKMKQPAVAVTTAVSAPVAATVAIQKAPAAVKKPTVVAATKTAVQKKKKEVVAVDSETEEDDEDDVDFAPRSPIATKRAPRAAAQKKIVYSVDTDDEEAEFGEEVDDEGFSGSDVEEEEDEDSYSDEDDNSDFGGKKKAKKPSAIVKTQAAAPAKAKVPVVAAAKAKAVPKTTTTAKASSGATTAVNKTKKRLKRNKDDEDSEDEEDEEADDVYLASPVPTPQAVKKPRTMNQSKKTVTKTLDMNVASTAAPAPAAKKAPAKPKTTKAAATSASAKPAGSKKAKKIVDSDDDDDLMLVDSPVKVSNNKPQRQRKTTNYAKYYSDEEEEEDEASFDEEDESDYDD